MSKKTPPWIVLTTDKPGLDAQNRNDINEWCGVIGKQQKYRRHRKKKIQFFPRSVYWKKHSPSHVDRPELSKLICDEAQGPSSPELRVAHRADYNDGLDLEASVPRPSLKNYQRPVKKERRKNGEERSSFHAPQSDNIADSSRSHASTRRSSRKPDVSQDISTLLWRDGSMGIRVDPFHCVPGTKDDPRQAEIIDYYTQILDPGVITTFFVFDMRSTYGSLPLECLMDEEFRPLGLASIAGTMSSVRHAAVNREYVFEQLGKGMRLLRLRLNRPGAADKDIVLISVLFLASTAYITGDMEGFELHRTRLKQMVTSRGGLDHLGYDGGTKTVLLQWDASWKLSTGKSLWIDERPRTKPIYPPFPLERRLLSLVESFPSGFRELCTETSISVDILKLIHRMNVAMSYKSSRGIPYNQKVGQHDDYLSIASLYDLAGVNDDDGEGSSRTLEGLLGLGLLIFSSTAFNELRATPVVFRGPRDALHKRLLSYGRDNPKFSHGSQTECFQWIWAVTVDAWRDASRELMPEGRHLLAQFHVKYGSTLGSPRHLASLLKRFFWIDDFIDFHEQSYTLFKLEAG